MHQTHALGHLGRLGVASGIPPRRPPEIQAVAGMGLHRQREVVPYRQPIKDAGDLERTRQAMRHPLVHRHAGDVHAVKLDAPGVGGQRAGNQLDQGGFAGTVGADQGVHLTRAHAQAGVIGGAQTAIGLDQAIDLQQRAVAHGVFLFKRRLSRPLGASSTTASSTAPRPNCQ